MKNEVQQLNAKTSMEDFISDRSMMREPLLGTSKGGLRTLPFILANEAFEKAASYGLLPNMILYLMGGYAIIPGARPCDESGSECTSWNIFQFTLLASSFALMSIGAGGIRSSSLAFGADQLLTRDDLGNAGILERFFNWYYFAASAAVVVALTLVVYIQEQFGWKVGFGVPVMLMLLSSLSFFLASPFYVKLKAKAGSFVSFAQVLIASWRKRSLHLSESADEVYYPKKGSRPTRPSDKLRFLNKACIVGNAQEELTPDGNASDPWRLCTIDQVEELKALIKVIPMWSTGVVMSVTISQTTFPVLQAGSMDRHIISYFEVPAGSFATFTIISILLWIGTYDRIIIPLAARIMGKPARLSVRKRMGIGLILSSMSMVVCAIIEGVRRETAIKEGFSDDPKGVTDMSAYWLLIHHMVSGMAEALFAVGQNEFFYSEFPKSMASVATNLYGVGMSVASLIASLIMSSIDSITSRDGKESWVSSNINKAHFDYYYWFLAGLSIVNFFYYLLCSRAYGPSLGEQNRFWDDEEIVNE
ncbi:protein NRT1/ PTR FAMILY 1.2 isoform X2 [Beta vulgaris subsp. vulgaris]|uniref:protein NRT1/ PTR FAMILY 1.2 isoform X2 n=1 Tax=Beta vulgaris subsp. vulgaris TaxID=3555 RepID=UPI0020374F85|nr:protein NRT1/ PTR FAMILY 1.2 isoform X2 [Beta vulgaris subsp. vulgaris]